MLISCFLLIFITNILNVNGGGFYRNERNTVGRQILNNKYKFNHPAFIVDKNNKFINKNNYNFGNKTITISPSGLYGFYTLGICSVVKDKKKDLNDYIVNGVSSGSWNSIFLAYNGDTDYFINKIFNSEFNKCNKINEIQNLMKYNILSNFEINEFNLKNTYITINGYHKKEMKTLFFNEFNTLEDVVDCCIGSSNIPYITGSIVCKYRNILAFDGGFCENPYVIPKDESLHISRKMFDRFSYNEDSFDMSISKRELFNLGRKDAENSKLFTLNIL